METVYGRAETECDNEISFNRGAGGKQQNDCRDLIINYLSNPALIAGRRLANRLEGVTTLRSGLGLLFLMAGAEGQSQKIVISRFAANSAISAEEGEDELTVEFLERVFVKNAGAYKAAVYRGSSLQSGFWKGRAIDRQINHPEIQLSRYWIEEFLDSDSLTTSAFASRRLAIALRDAGRKSNNVTIKTEIASAVTLATGLNGQRLSIRDFETRMAISPATREAIAREVRNERAIDERFRFDADEFSRHVAYRTVELDSGGMLTAETSNFDKAFKHSTVDAVKQIVRYSAEGKVVDDKLAKLK